MGIVVTQLRHLPAAMQEQLVNSSSSIADSRAWRVSALSPSRIAGFGDHRPAQQHPGFFWLALFAGEDAEFVERLGELGLQLEQGFQQRPICAIAGASVAGPDLLLTKDPAAKVESRESTP